MPCNLLRFLLHFRRHLFQRRETSEQRHRDYGLPGWHVMAARGGYSHTLPMRVCAAQRGRDFEAPGLERGIHFRGVF